MVDALSSLDKVYAKWEGRSPYQVGGGGGGGREQQQHVSKPAPTYNIITNSGKQAWKKKFDSVGPPVPRRNRYRSNQKDSAILSNSLASRNTVGSFKQAPTVVPVSRPRPLSGRCCTCMPNSRNSFYNDSIKDAGLQDIFRVGTKLPENGFLTRRFAHFVFAMQRKGSFQYPEVSVTVLTSPRLVDAVQKATTEKAANLDNVRSMKNKLKGLERRQECRARAIMMRMRAALSNRLIRFTGWFLHKFLGRLLSGVIIHRGQLEMVKQASRRDLPLIFLPTHRSHLDYILITFILWNNDMMPPHVAAGDNLLIPVFGYLLRGLGGYFIRRKLDKEGKKDYVYRAVLQTYMEELLKRNMPFEFFVEGGRTRSGKALYPKGGLLSVIVDSFNQGKMTDALMVPVSISYDKLMDGNFTKEQMGQPKVRETFIRAMRAIWQVLMSKYGLVRVDFGQPFSLKEFLLQAQNFQGDMHRCSSVGSSCGTPSPGSESPPLPNDVMKISPSDCSMYGMDIVVDDQRKLIHALAEHIVYANVKMQTLMSTQLLSFLLLLRHRQGIDMMGLIADFDWLKEEIYNHGCDMGFVGKTPDVIAHALSLLGDQLVKKHPIRDKNDVVMKSNNSKNNIVENVFIEPTTSLPDIFELVYYSNVVSSVFALESIVANALCSLLEPEAEVARREETAGRSSISKQKLLETAAELCRLLKFEYIFKPPCVLLDQAVSDAFDVFVSHDILIREEDCKPCLDTQERDMAQRLNNTLSFANEGDSDDEDDWVTPDVFYVVNREDSYCMDRLAFLKAVLAPILETYYVVACNITLLAEGDMAEGDFVSVVHKSLKDRVSSGVASYEESAAIDSVKNAVRSFQSLEVLECYEVVNLRMLSLQRVYRKHPDRINSLVESLECYRV